MRFPEAKNARLLYCMFYTIFTPSLAYLVTKNLLTANKLHSALHFFSSVAPKTARRVSPEVAGHVNRVAESMQPCTAQATSREVCRSSIDEGACGEAELPILPGMAHATNKCGFILKKVQSSVQLVASRAVSTHAFYNSVIERDHFAYLIMAVSQAPELFLEKEWTRCMQYVQPSSYYVYKSSCPRLLRRIGVWQPVCKTARLRSEKNHKEQKGIKWSTSAQ